ncbi:unnamed protein product, partial [Ixodes hexagonus]
TDLLQGKTLLEVGTGPSPYNVLSASKQFRHIVLSDLVDLNRVELEKWLRDSEDAIDWTQRAEQVAAWEGCSDTKKRASELMERTKHAVRKVISCDVLEPGVLPEEYRETFDVVLSCNCLEGATTDHESFRRALCNVVTLIKPGGQLVLVGAGGMENFEMANELFQMANLNDDVIKQAVVDANLRLEVYHTRIIYQDREKNIPHRRYMFALVARKL